MPYQCSVMNANAGLAAGRFSNVILGEIFECELPHTSPAAS
jgi:hypothetical protein